MANSLSSVRENAAPSQHPMKAHAQMWQHIGRMAPNELEQASAASNFVIPILGKLAGNPKVTRKDVIKAAADAAGSGKIPPSQAVSFISDMPNEPDKVQPWLRNLYAGHMMAAVHMKAAAMPDAAPQPQGVPAQ